MNAPAAGAQRGSGAAPAGTSRSPDRGPKPVLRWLLLAACMLPAVGLIALELGQSGARPGLEAKTVARAGQTLSAMTAENRPGGGAGLAPVYAGRREWTTPPGPTWVYGCSIALGERLGGPLGPSGQLLVARGIAGLAGLASVAAVFWAGASIGTLRTAALAALLLVASPFFIWQARTASPVILEMAVLALGVASALWAIRPLRPSPALWHQAIGWAGTGCMLAGAALVGGVPALLKGVILVLVILTLCPGRLHHMLGLLAAALLAVLAAGSWAVVVYQHEPEALAALWMGGEAAMGWAETPYLSRLLERAMLLWPATVPWTLWMIGALVQPLSTSSEGIRSRLFLGWAWFMTAIFILLLWPGSVPAGIAMILPAGAVMTAQLFRQCEDLASEGRAPRFWRILQWPHTAAVMAISVAGPLAAWGEPVLIRDGWLAAPVWASPGPWYEPTAIATLLVLGMIGFYEATRHRPTRAVVAWAGWAMVAMAFLVIPLVRGPAAENPYRADGLRLAEVAGPMMVLRLEERHGPAPRGEASLALYAQRPVPAIAPGQLPEAIRTHGALVVLVAGGRKAPVLPGLEREPVLTLDRVEQVAWRYTPETEP